MYVREIRHRMWIGAAGLMRSAGVLCLSAMTVIAVVSCGGDDESPAPEPPAPTPPADAVTVLPNPDGSELNLKVDYTLLSRDGNGEEIKVIGATATVPATFAKWQPNNSYTYIFKISDNTNGAVGSIIGLRPITLDAVVNTDADGRQETVTTVTELLI